MLTAEMTQHAMEGDIAHERHTIAWRDQLNDGPNRHCNEYRRENWLTGKCGSYHRLIGSR